MWAWHHCRQACGTYMAIRTAMQRGALHAKSTTAERNEPISSYELLRPDGTGTGVWACECQKPHVVAWRSNLPVAESNKKAADESCAPRNCRYCGQPTQRD